MAGPRLTKLELRVMDALWKHGPASVRQVQETLREAIARLRSPDGPR